MECRLAGETEVLGENLLQRHFCPSQNPTWPDPGLNPGRRDGKPATNRLSYGAAYPTCIYWLRLATHTQRHRSYDVSTIQVASRSRIQSVVLAFIRDDMRHLPYDSRKEVVTCVSEP
jgi:hypothetical protein